jgi:hypothetical protein
VNIRLVLRYPLRIIKSKSENLKERYHFEHPVIDGNKKKLNSVALVRKRTIPTERPPLVGEVSANLCG